MASVQLFLLVLALTAWHMEEPVDALCCPKNLFTWKCNDCQLGTPCCGVGSCNSLLCCGCSACRTGTCKKRRSLDDMLQGVVEEDTGAHSIVRMADQDKDGLMSIEEAHAYLGDTADRKKRDVDLQMLDANNDGFLSAEEIDV